MNWLKQNDKPLFEDILWSRPENRRHAGKLLIIGGHGQSFTAVSQTYSAASEAGIGTARVIVPDSLNKILKGIFPEAEYAVSTPIGSFSRKALAELLDASSWADGVLLAGDFGRNSETAILLENFVKKYDGHLALAGDSIDYFFNQPSVISDRSRTLIVGSVKQLQKLAIPQLIEQRTDLIKFADQISSWISPRRLDVMTLHSEQLVVASGDQLSTTPINLDNPDMKLVSLASVWWLQQPEKPFEALTTAAYCYSL